MNTNIRLIRKARRYSEEFKRSIVTKFESGEFGVYELERLYGITNASIYRWIYEFSTFNKEGYRIVEMKESSSKKIKSLEQKVKELERLVGQKQIKIEYLEKMIEIAKEEFDIDIKKNSDTPQSTGSGKTAKS